MTTLDLLLEPLGYTFVHAFIVTTVLLSAWAVLLVARRLGKVADADRALRKAAVMLIVVTLAGAVFDVLWVWLFAGRLYVDPDPIIGFSPFIPFTIDSGGRFLRGATLGRMQLLWTVFAIACWTCAYGLYRLVRARGLALLNEFLHGSAEHVAAPVGKGDV
jgi:hypothetical protein